MSCLQTFTEQKFANVAVASSTAAGVSLLACLLALFVVILFKKWQSFGQRLIAYLIIAATLFSLASLLRRVEFDDNFTPADARFCAFSGFAVQLAVWCLITSIVAITVYLFLGVVCDRFTDKYEWLYVLFIFVTPLIFGWIPFIHNTYGRSGVWCWIKLADYTTCERLLFGLVLQVVLFYAPVLIILPCIVLAYLFILCKAGRKRWTVSVVDTDYSSKIMKSETARLLAYPLIFSFLLLPALAVRLQGWIAPQHLILGLWYLSVVTANLNGAVISLAFLLDKDTRQRLKWSHIRAAFKNYFSQKRVSEYPIDEAGNETDMSGGSKVPYVQVISDDSWSRSRVESF
jgi:hypothetical protein